MSQSFKEKIKSLLYNKTTIMIIPHSQKSVFNLHLPHWLLYVFILFFFVLGVSSILLTPSINNKIEEYNYFQKSNSGFEKQIQSTKNVLPKIKASQETVSNQLSQIFNIVNLPTIQNAKDFLYLDNLNQSSNTFNNDNYIYFLNYLENKMNNIGLYIHNFKNFFRSIPAILPTDAYFFISSPFGWRIHPITHMRKFHTGIDLAILPGTPILATADGTIDQAGWRGGYGIAVFIRHSHGYDSRYAHMLRLPSNIHKGIFVHRGQVIGYVGASGVATGFHLHYEIRLNGDPINPNPSLYIDRFR